jgi:excinuclease ABC subunit C
LTTKKIRILYFYPPLQMRQTLEIKQKLKTVSRQPGVYQFKDKGGRIIYVGKAKALRNRLNSYFANPETLNGKTRVMMLKVTDFETIVVESELDALLLENNLIKKYQPRYNILLKDDKSFPWICIKNERFPRIFPTRQMVKDGSEYFGPYASVKMMKTLLDLIRQLYPIRTCNYNLSEENISSGKFKVCLEYHIGKCLGPCVGKHNEENYLSDIAEIRQIIRGNIRQMIRSLNDKMAGFAKNLEFEKAQVVKEKITQLEKYQAKSAVVSPRIKNVDVFSIESDLRTAYVNYLRVVDGSIVQGHTLEIRKRLEESDEQLLLSGILSLRDQFKSDAKEMIVPFAPEIDLEFAKWVVPQRGEKKDLLELSSRNARYYMLEQHKQQALVDPERNTNRILGQLQKDLRLQEIPRLIECFDNSNLQGSHPVAACVVFKDGKPSKKDYRHFNIKTVEGPDDFASMEEVVYRRYKRLLDENQPLPQLIVIDGGKGQLSSATKSLDKLGIRGRIGIVGIAKRLEEIYYPGDSIPVHINKKSESLKVLQHLRNEAHRFGITFHRNKRSKAATQSVLTQINGIGFKTAQQLLWKFKSVKRIKEASQDELETAVGKRMAHIVYSYFHNENKS